MRASIKPSVNGCSQHQVEPNTMSDDKSEAQVEQAVPDSANQKKNDETAQPGAGFSWLGVFNLLLILVLAAATAYYWQLQQKTEVEKRMALEDLRQQLATRVTMDQVQSDLHPLQSGLVEITGRVEQLQQQQQDLQASGEELYDLFGRDQNGWQLAEVEYLMRIAQHKLILENDFKGAAMTLQAASERIAVMGDMGLLPVRLQISDEIAELKVHRGTDLVDMTLQLSQLGHQIRSLQPGFPPVVKETSDIDTAVNQQARTDENMGLFASIQTRLFAWMNSLVRIHYDHAPVSTLQTETFIISVGEKLQDNLKLARWAVLERDVFHYQRLMAENVELFEEFYTLDNAANHDFYSSLQALQNTQIKPEKPDITGSFILLQKIISQRDDAESKIISEDADNIEDADNV